MKYTTSMDNYLLFTALSEMSVNLKIVWESIANVALDNKKKVLQRHLDIGIQVKANNMDGNIVYYCMS